jgi:hypothetical protein
MYFFNIIEVILRLGCSDLGERDKRFLLDCLEQLYTHDLSEKQFKTISGMSVARLVQLGPMSVVRLGLILDGPQSVLDPHMAPSERSLQVHYLTRWWANELNSEDSTEDLSDPEIQLQQKQSEIDQLTARAAGLEAILAASTASAAPKARADTAHRSQD